MKSFSSVTVGIADLERALEFWVGTFGLEMVEQKRGADSELSRLWGIDLSDIRRQALVRTPGQRHGMVHFVEFDDPDPPVREGAATFDSCPKNLDLYVDDMARQVESLKRKGHEFRNGQFSEINASNGTRVREIHLPAHDHLNIVLLQMIDEVLDFSPRGFSGVGPLITVVPNAEKERHFYETMLNLDMLSEDVLQGPEVETMIGLPPGAELHFSIWGHVDAPFGRVEVISYTGVEGRNLFPLASPKARGILHICYQTDDLPALLCRLESAGVEHSTHGNVTTLASRGETISFKTPAGFRIEVVQNE